MMEVRDDPLAMRGAPGGRGASVTGTILEPYIALFNGRYGLAALAGGFLVFASGLLLALTFGLSSEYLSTPQIHLGTCAIVWVTWCVAWGTRRMRVLVERVRPVFVTPQRFEAEVAHFERWVGNRRLQWLVALMLWAINVVDMYFRSRSEEGLVAFAAIWSDDPHLAVKNIILATYSLAAFLLLAAGGAGAFGYLSFVGRLARLPLLPLLPVARAKLRGLTDFSIAIGLAWSVGVSLVVLVYQLEFRAQAVASVLVFTAVGLAVLVRAGVDDPSCTRKAASRSAGRCHSAAERRGDDRRCGG
jgi:hypothetical protein